MGTSGGNVKMVHAEDVSPLAMQCKQLRNAEGNGWTKDRGFRLIARIPAIAFFDKKELANPDGTINKKEMKRYLRSPEGELFRTVDKGL